MAKKHIDQATNEQIDYAVAVAQGWKFNESEWSDKNGETIIHFFEKYHPTTDQAQCGKLIDKFRINCEANAFSAFSIWKCFIYSQNKKIVNESRLVAACKAFLWSKYPDGMIPIQETKNE